MMTGCIRPDPEALFTEVDGEAVLLDLRSGQYYGLDALGTRIWTLLGEHRSLAAVREALLAEYDVEEARLQADLETFVKSLVDAGLLRVTPE